MEITTYNIIMATFERYEAERILRIHEYKALELADYLENKLTFCFNEQGKPISIYDVTSEQQDDMSAELHENIIAITFNMDMAFDFNSRQDTEAALHDNDVFLTLAKYTNNFGEEYQYAELYTVWQIDIEADFARDTWDSKVIGVFGRSQLPRFTLYPALVMLLKQCVPALEHLMRTVDESAEHSVVYQNVLNDIRSFLKKEESDDSTR